MNAPKIDDAILRLQAGNAGKKRINSGKKGHNWENDVAIILTARFGGLKFTRTPQSGAHATCDRTDKRAKEILSGDIICPDGFMWTIESKKGYDIDIINLFANPLTKGKTTDVKELEKFWEQANAQATNVSKKPAVIYRKDNRPAIVMLDKNNGGCAITNAVHPPTEMHWCNWIFISLYDWLSAPDALFFEPRALPLPEPLVAWGELRSIGDLEKKVKDQKRLVQEAMTAPVVDNLTVNELAKLPADHPMRKKLMPSRFGEGITVEEFIGKFVR